MRLFQHIICFSFQIELMKQTHPKSCTALKKKDRAVHSAIIDANKQSTTTSLFHRRQSMDLQNKSESDIGSKVGTLTMYFYICENVGYAYSLVGTQWLL